MMDCIKSLFQINKYTTWEQALVHVFVYGTYNVKSWMRFAEAILRWWESIILLNKRFHSGVDNFCDCMRDSIIRDRIVLGIQDHRTRKWLLQERSLTLSKCIDLCKSSEATNLQLKMMSDTQNEDVHAVQDKQPPPGCRDDKSKKSRAGKTKTCKFCGKAHPFEKGKCSVSGAKCT